MKCRFVNGAAIANISVTELFGCCYRNFVKIPYWEELLLSALFSNNVITAVDGSSLSLILMLSLAPFADGSLPLITIFSPSAGELQKTSSYGYWK